MNGHPSRCVRCDSPKPDIPGRLCTECVGRCYVCGNLIESDHLSYCVSCEREVNKRYREANRENAAAATKTWRQANPERDKENNRRWNAANRDKIRKRNVRIYGITEAEYDDLLERQNGVCAVCGTDSPGSEGRTRFFIDHDHSCCPGGTACGKCVRGLLCVHCNSALGYAKDNPMLLRSLALYLEQYQERLAA